MSDYDAFGRKKDEAGHDDLGWGTSAERAATYKPAPSVTASDSSVAASATDTGFSSPSEFTSVSTSPPPRRTRRPGRSPIALLVQLIVLGAVAFAIYSAVDAGRDAADSVRDTFNQFSPPGNGNGGGGGGNRGDDTVPEQVKPRDLFGSAGDLRQALRIMEREVPGRITNFSIHRDNGINAQVVGGGERAVVLFAPDAEVPEVISRSEGSASAGSFSYEEINPTAASRLMKSANSRLGQSPADVDYFVVSESPTGGMQWGIYYEGGKPIALGDSRGQYTRRIA